MYELKVELPLPYKSQAVNRKSNALMTINIQRNLHYKAAALFKRKYGEKCKEAIKKANPTKVFNCIELEYTLHTLSTKGNPTKKEPYRGSGPKNIDLVNVLATVDKVLSDVLVSEGRLPDDSLKYIQKVTFKTDPYSNKEGITVLIKEIEPIKDNRINNDN